MKSCKTRFTRLLTSFILASSTVLIGCSDPETAESSDAPSVLEAFLLQVEPEGAVPVRAARALAKPGAPIVVAGQIGGALHPFSQTHASFVLSDPDILFCNETPGDTCSTPWDACCEDAEKLASGRATVQILQGEFPLVGTLRNVGNLRELDHVVVTGKVDPASTPQNLVINVDGIYRRES